MFTIFDLRIKETQKALLRELTAIRELLSPARPAPFKETIFPDKGASTGDPNAPLVLAEFSDYQCPLSKKHFLTVYRPLIAEYVKTGPAAIYLPEFSAGIHTPVGHQAAEAASCAGG